jgi:hypothetical protein
VCAARLANGRGTRVRLALRQVLGLVTKILHGARPQDLPIEQPAKFDFVVTVKTAKEIGVGALPAIPKTPSAEIAPCD